jgi:CheY-like chemotaxis protein
MRRHALLGSSLGGDAGGPSFPGPSTPPRPYPLPSSLGARRRSAADRDDAAARSVRVLVVDDEPMVRTLLRLLIDRDERFEIVEEATDGEEAVAAASRTQPDVVLLDLLMPRMSGHDALPTIRREAPDAMVLVLSSLSAVDEEAAALGGGAHAFLEKSAMGPDLTTTVHEHLERFRSSGT